MALAASMSRMLGGMSVSEERCAHVLNTRAEWSDKKAISVLLGMLDVGEDLGAWMESPAATEGRLVSALSSKLLDEISRYLNLASILSLLSCSKILQSKLSTWCVPETLTLRLSGDEEGEGRKLPYFGTNMSQEEILPQNVRPCDLKMQQITPRQIRSMF